MLEVKSLKASEYQRHPIHSGERIWAETNCYADVLIELIHGLGFEPSAALAFTLAIDFEGDQWTFFKFPHEDLLQLFGIEIQEFNPWHSLADHVAKQISLGRPVLVEMDSFYLPDTAGTAYQLAHVKSTIAVNAIDIEQKFLGYFHGQSYYELQGEDFIQLFQLQGLAHERVLPPYIEYVKLGRNNQIPQGEALVKASLQLLKKHLQRIPANNPFSTFKSSFAQDYEWLLTQDIEQFHRYAFATLRQYGACFELMATYLDWLQQHGQKHLEFAITQFIDISTQTKALQFQLARSLARKRLLDTSPLEQMAEQWRSAMASLRQNYGDTA